MSASTQAGVGQMRHALPTLLKAALVAASAYLAWVGGDRPIRFLANPLGSDFALYYRDAQVGLRHGWAHMYDLAPYLQVTHQLGIANHDPQVASLSFPLLTWLVAPLALLPLPVAYAIWLGLCALCIGACWALTGPDRAWPRAWHLALAVAFPPTAFAFGLGQSVLIVALAVAGATWLLRTRRDVLAGLTLALVAVKPHVAVLVPVALLMIGRRRALAAWAAATVAVVLAVLIVVPTPSILQYVERLAGASRNTLAWGVIPDLTFAGLASPWAVIAEAGAAVAALVVVWLNRRGEVGLPIAAALIGSQLTTPYLHYDDLVLLLVAGWLCLATRRAPWQLWILAGGFAAGVIGPLAGFGLLHAAEFAWLVVLAFPKLESLVDSTAGRTVRRPEGSPLASSTPTLS